MMIHTGLWKLSMKEFEFIKVLETEYNKDNLIGDDAALIYDNILISKDILVESIHFLKSTPLEYVIHKLFTANISDIASMGGTAEYIFLGIAAENGAVLEEIISYVKNECEKYNVVLAGGDTTSSKGGLFLSLTVAGKKGKNIIKRSGAKEGDIIFLSRSVGKCRISLEKELNIHDFSVDKYYHYKKDAEYALGSMLSSFDFVSSMTDISDGLSIDLLNIARSSNKKAVLEYNKLPLEYLNEYNVDCVDYFLSSGEEFALLFTVENSKSQFIKDYIQEKLGIQIIEIGRIENGSGLYIEKNGIQQKISSQGYEHFK